MEIDIQKINSNHKEAMNLALEASVEEKRGNSSLANVLYKKAYELERDAAWELIPHQDKEPTRSILFRSAASLAKKCGLIDDGKQLIQLALNGNPPANVKQQLSDLKESLEIKPKVGENAELRIAARSNATITNNEKKEIKKRFKDNV